MRLVIFQPDIPQNTGTMIRTAACFNISVDIIEPCGFVWSDKHLKRAEMDYQSLAHVVRHKSWEDYIANNKHRRLVLLTTKGDCAYSDFSFQKNDALIVGRESSGVPSEVHSVVDARLFIPMYNKGARSLNVAVSAAIVLSEGLRQSAI